MEQACGVRTDGTLECWSCAPAPHVLDQAGSDIVPETPAGEFSRVLVGYGTACAQDVTGALTCWGDDWLEGQVGAVPVGPVLDFATSETYDSALLLDGTVTWWGYDSEWGSAIPPANPLTDLSIGLRHACGLDSAGTAWCWGTTPYGDPFPPPPLGPFAQVESFGAVSCVIEAAGTATCWGNDMWTGQTPAVPFAQIGVGWLGACGVDTSGVAWCWGQGTGTEPEFQIPDLNGPP